MSVSDGYACEILDTANMATFKAIPFTEKLVAIELIDVTRDPPKITRWEKKDAPPT